MAFPARNRLGFLAFALALLWLARGIGLAAGFSTTLDREAIRLGETAELALIFEGADPGGTPGLPAIEGLRITAGGRSSEFSFINGAATAKVKFTYTVQPTRVGDFVIPALQANVGGRQFSSQPLTLKVLPPSAAPSPTEAAAAGQIAFLKLVAPKTNLYVGELTVVDLHLYLRQDIRDLQNFQATGTPADGLSVGKLLEGGRRQVRIGNAQYTVITLQMPVTALRAGEVKLGPISCNIVYTAQSGRRAGRDPFGVFGDFFGMQPQQAALASDQVVLHAQPVPPDNVPPGFNGAVGQYTLNLSVSPTNVAVGEPITVRVQITGSGAVDGIQLPPQPGWDRFKQYPPTSRLENQGPLGTQGTKSFDLAVVPEQADLRELPGFTFSFFDPEARQYRTLSHPATPIVVRPSAGLTPPPVAPGEQANAAPTRDIVPIKQRPGTLAVVGAPLLQQPWFLALQGLPVLAWAGALLWRKRVDRLANNPRLRRRQEVARFVRGGLDQLRQRAAQNDPEQFFVWLFRILQEQLGECLDMAASAITEAVVDERLRPLGVPEGVLDELHGLFQTCNAARYAPIRGSQELAALIPRLEAALAELRKVEA